MLEKVFKNIEKEVEREIEKILKEKEEKLLKLEKDLDQALEKRKNQEKRNLEEQIKAEVASSEEEETRKNKFTFQEERNKILRTVYKEAEAQICELQDEKFEKLIKKMLAFLPKGKEGKFRAGKRTAGVLKTVLGQNEVIAQDHLKEEGFIFDSPSFELDLRFSQILEQLREKTDPELAKLLFD